MTTKHLLLWIDNQILLHQREISKLTIAREVIADAKLEVEPAAEPKPKKAKGTRKSTFRKIVEVVTQPMTTKQVIEAVRTKYPQAAEKSIYNALYNGRKVGRIIFDHDSRSYSMPQKQHKSDTIQ
jgi:hypothetical protein